MSEGYMINAYALGIKKKCRKIDRHCFEMYVGLTNQPGTLSQDPLDHALLIKHAKDILKREMKSVNKAIIAVDHIQCGTFGAGFIEFEPFDKRNFKIEIPFNDATESEQVALIA